MKECYMHKHLWLCCRKELMVRLSGGGGGTSLGALREGCSSWALRGENPTCWFMWRSKGNWPHRVLWSWWGPCKDSSRLCWDSSRGPSVLNGAERDKIKQEQDVLSALRATCWDSDTILCLFTAGWCLGYIRLLLKMCLIWKAYQTFGSLLFVGFFHLNET